MDIDSPRSGASTPVQDETGRSTPVMDETMEGGGTPSQTMEGGGTPLQDEGGVTPVQDEGGYTPLRDEPVYQMRGSPQDAEMDSDNEIDRGGGGLLGNNDDEYVSDGGEVEREEVEQEGPRSPNSGPVSPAQSLPGSPDENMSPKSPERSPRSVHSGSGPQSPKGSPRSVHSGSGPQSPKGSPISVHSGSGPRSPSVGSPVGSPRSPGSGPASPAGSQRSQSRSRSRSGSPVQPRSRSGSPRSRSGSPRSRSGSPARSRSQSPARSRSQSPARSRSGSARSRSASPVRSRSGSPRSRSGSPARSRSGSPRSKSGSPARSRSGSVRSRSRSGSRSRSRSRSGSPRSRSGSPARSRSRSRSRSASPGRDGSPGPGYDSEDETKSKKKKGSDEEDDSDKESEVGELIANIFGSSDEEEEFEGFDKTDIEAANKKKEKKKSAIVSDDDDDDEGKTTGQIDAVPELSDDENEDAVRKSAKDQEDFVSDFDLMMERKKAEQRKQRRKKKNEDFINDNDDLIADMICKMKEAAEQDRELNRTKKPAIKKLKYLPAVTSQLRKADLQEAFLDQGILNVMTEWLAPLPDKSLPHLQIRDNFLKLLQEFPTVSSDTLKTSGIGKAVMYLYKHPRESKENRDKCGKLINDWSRPIFSLTANHKSMTKEEREERDYEHLPKRRRLSAEGMTPRRDIDKVLAGEDQAPRVGEKGFIMRARVPMPSNKDYVVRPKWNQEYEMDTKSTRGKKDISRYEKHVRAFADRKKFGKSQRAVAISIEGKNMAL